MTYLWQFTYVLSLVPNLHFVIVKDITGSDTRIYPLHVIRSLYNINKYTPCEAAYSVKVPLVPKPNGAFDILYCILCPIDMFTLCALWIWHRKSMSLPSPFDIALHGLVFKTRSHLWSLKGSEISQRNGIISLGLTFCTVSFPISIHTINKTVELFIRLINLWWEMFKDLIW